MPIALLFWILFLLWIVLSVYFDSTPRSIGRLALIAALIFILGWRVFGSILQG